MVRSVDALAGQNPPGGTSAFFRALDEADHIVHAAEQRDELQARLDELPKVDVGPRDQYGRQHVVVEIDGVWWTGWLEPAGARE
jgi:hypothetical protein